MNRPGIFLRVLLGIIALCFCAALHAADWYRWRGPNFNGISQEKDWLAKLPAEGPKQLWKAKVGIGFSSDVGQRWARLHDGQ